MGDTDRDNARHSVCGQRGAAVEISWLNSVYRRGRADDFFPDHAVPQTTVQLGHGQEGTENADLYFYFNLSYGWVVAGA